MPSGRRHARAEERSLRARGRRPSYPEADAVEAACQGLLDAWPWLTEQYRLGLVPELPHGPMGAAIRRYLETAGD